MKKSRNYKEMRINQNDSFEPTIYWTNNDTFMNDKQFRTSEKNSNWNDSYGIWLIRAAGWYWTTENCDFITMITAYFTVSNGPFENHVFRLLASFIIFMKLSRI